jgi:hypothetical protein
MRRALWFVAFILGAASATAGPSDDAVEKMLGALGGRSVWAATTSTMNDSQPNRAADPAVVRALIWLDFTQPRFRIETRGPGFTTVRVIDGERSWRRLRDGKIEAVPADLYAEEMSWYGAHVYRSIHRLAVRDPKLSTGLGADGRLEVFEDGKRLIWFKLAKTISALCAGRGSLRPAGSSIRFGCRVPTEHGARISRRSNSIRKWAPGSWRGLPLEVESPVFRCRFRGL